MADPNHQQVCLTCERKTLSKEQLDLHRKRGKCSAKKEIKAEKRKANSRLAKKEEKKKEKKKEQTEEEE